MFLNIVRGADQPGKREDLVETREVDRALDERVFENGLDFGAENKHAIGHRVIERLI